MGILAQKSYLREREVFSGVGKLVSRIELGEKLSKKVVSAGDFQVQETLEHTLHSRVCLTLR